MWWKGKIPNINYSRSVWLRGIPLALYVTLSAQLLLNPAMDFGETVHKASVAGVWAILKNVQDIKYIMKDKDRGIQLSDEHARAILKKNSIPLPAHPDLKVSEDWKNIRAPRPTDEDEELERVEALEQQEAAKKTGDKYNMDNVNKTMERFNYWKNESLQIGQNYDREIPKIKNEVQLIIFTDKSYKAMLAQLTKSKVIALSLQKFTNPIQVTSDVLQKNDEIKKTIRQLHKTTKELRERSDKLRNELLILRSDKR